MTVYLTLYEERVLGCLPARRDLWAVRAAAVRDLEFLSVLLSSSSQKPFMVSFLEEGVPLVLP